MLKSEIMDSKCSGMVIGRTNVGG